jgi:hypothetical protein
MDMTTSTARREFTTGLALPPQRPQRTVPGVRTRDPEPVQLGAGQRAALAVVGRDCAGKLFGCEVDGDAIYKGRAS